jgi:hypothetical protein
MLLWLALKFDGTIQRRFTSLTPARETEMSRFLMIQNKGVAPLEGFTVLGVSGTSSSGDANTIGMFGSGTKLAINLFLRQGIEPIIYCGGLKLTFYCENRTMDEGIAQKDYGQVHCRAQGTYNGRQINKELPLSWAANWGEKDWDTVWMALREFTANAIDRTIRENGDFLDSIKSGDLKVDIVPEKSVRAKSEYTRIFIPLEHEEVSKFYVELPKRFLHFSEHPEDVTKDILSKGHNITKDKHTPVVYHHGVFIREVEGEDPSIFDYNFTRHELQIDECRNCNDSSVKTAVARKLKYADVDTLSEVFRRLGRGEKIYEGDLSSWDLSFTYDYSSKKDKAKENWHEAWNKACGNAVMAETDHGQELLALKGHQSVRVPIAWSGAAFGLDIQPIEGRVLSKSEKEGNEEIPATIELKTTLDTVWGWLDKLKLTNGKSKPECACFRKLVDAGSVKMGFFDGNKIYVNIDHARSMGMELQKTVLEELVHYVTGSGDLSRDFQEYLLSVVVNMADAAIF